MKYKPVARSQQPVGRGRENPVSHSLPATGYQLPANRGFTLVETLVAITLLSVAIVAPMTLTTRSLGSSYYARDQMIASHLAQEAIESVRHLRDGNILKIAKGTLVGLLDGIPSLAGEAFTIDTRDDSAVPCPGGNCPALQSDGQVYAYESNAYRQGGSPGNPSWTKTKFTRSVTVNAVGGGSDEVRVAVTVSWRTEGLNERSVVVTENMYKWVEEGSAE